ncbi:MAG: prepilin peptidase [Planctomycetes bacterium]|nr:prepilin peptidase [Planctomycetota bacterium]
MDRLTTAALFFMLGLAAGSFCNVVIHRLPRGESLAYPASHCPACGLRIGWIDLIPIIGWLRLGGKCRHCGGAISIRYPAVELFTAMLWSYGGWRMADGLGWSDASWFETYAPGLAGLIFTSSMVIVFCIDLDCRRIPDGITLGGSVFSLIAAALAPALHHADSLFDFIAFSPELAKVIGGWPGWSRGLVASALGGAAGYVLGSGFRLLGAVAFSRRVREANRADPDIDTAFGLGDVRLLGFCGAFLGWRGIIFATLMAAVAGSCYGIAALASRRRDPVRVIPFGPFIAVASAAVFWFG